MCGRYLLTSPAAEVAAVFGADPSALPAVGPRYNIAPTQAVMTVRAVQDGQGREKRVLSMMRWGMIPRWARAEDIGSDVPNCEVEAAFGDGFGDADGALGEGGGKPMFRESIRSRRCLLPADGYFEWTSGEGSLGRVPMLVRVGGGEGREAGELFAMAGVWDVWERGECGLGGGVGGMVESCAVVTVRSVGAEEALRRIHGRMPVILPRGSWAAWLDGTTEMERVREMCVAYAGAVEVRAVGKAVNSPRNDGPGVLV